MKPLPAPARHATPAGASRLRPWAWLGALLGLALALLLQAPAQWLAAPLWQISRAHLGLLQAQGTVWQGSARLLLHGGPGSQAHSVLPGWVHWRLWPSGLGLGLQLEADCCTPAPLELQLAWDRPGFSLRLADQRSHWPADVASGLGAPWNTLQAQGQLDLQTESLQLHWREGRLQPSGAAVLEARHMASSLSTLKPMGSYRLSLGSMAGLPSLELVTLEGGLQLSGRGEWAGGHLRFRGEARATPEHEAALSNLLNIIGHRDGGRSIMTLG